MRTVLCETSWESARRATPRAAILAACCVLFALAFPAPALPAGYVGEEVCLSCHEALDEGFTHRWSRTVHAKLFAEQNARTVTMRQGCEACHGPGSAHVEGGGGKGVGDLVNFASGSADAVARENAVCQQCHQGGQRRYWQGSVHHQRDVSCTSCHTLMQQVSYDGQLSHATQNATCGQCHQIQNARIYRNAHMPLRPGKFQSSTADDGKLVCSSCHNPHGTVGEKLIGSVTINESCLSCHADKRGPFLWEHPPVAEDCLNCHDPHGTTRGKMLKLGVPRLCQTCHNANAHPSTPRTSNDRFMLGSSCLQCHLQIHGSNHPSGVGLTR